MSRYVARHRGQAARQRGYAARHGRVQQQTGSHEVAAAEPVLAGSLFVTQPGVVPLDALLFDEDQNASAHW